VAVDPDDQRVRGQGVEIPVHSGAEAGVAARVVVGVGPVGARAAAGPVVGRTVGFDPPSVEGDEVPAAQMLGDDLVREGLRVPADVCEVVRPELDLRGEALRVAAAERVGCAEGLYRRLCFVFGAYLAGVFSLEEALSLVVVRGQLLQSLEPGRMLAVIGLDPTIPN